MRDKPAFRAKKRFAQHFLAPAWADRVVAAIAPQRSDRFVEIGPGPGALTLRLAPLVSHLTAVELDRDLAADLRRQLPANVTLVEGNVLDMHNMDVGILAGTEPFRVAGNLPYNITSPILFRLLAARRAGVPLIDATLMVQREVAERIEAAPGSKTFGTLSIFVGLRARVRRMLTLPPGAFRPMPKVHSAVVRLEFHEPSVSIADERTFERLVRSIFTQRRKTLHNALKPFADEHGTDARRALASAQIDGMRRPETLQLEELARLAGTFVSNPERAVL